VVHPKGYRYLKRFRLDPFPVFTYEVQGIEIEKSAFMIQGENSTVVHYELKRNQSELPKDLRLEVQAADCLPRLSQHDASESSH
jgi:glycogen debranching enzyme